MNSVVSLLNVLSCLRFFLLKTDVCIGCLIFLGSIKAVSFCQFSGGNPTPGRLLSWAYDIWRWTKSSMIVPFVHLYMTLYHESMRFYGIAKSEYKLFGCITSAYVMTIKKLTVIDCHHGVKLQSIQMHDCSVHDPNSWLIFNFNDSIFNTTYINFFIKKKLIYFNVLSTSSCPVLGNLTAIALITVLMRFGFEILYGLNFLVRSKIWNPQIWMQSSIFRM